MRYLLRVITVSALLGGLVFVGYRQLADGAHRRAIARLEALNEDMRQMLAARSAMIERLGRSRRLAHLRVLDQSLDATGAVDRTRVLFIELDDDGSEIARQELTVPGDVLYVDAWTIRFDREDVALGDPLRGRSLVLLRRIYSDRMPPRDGIPLDTPGAVPPGYATTEPGRFEQQLWSHFWELATDAAAARRMGVRVAQGEAVYKPVAPGQLYELTVDAVGGMTLAPVLVADADGNGRRNLDG